MAGILPCPGGAVKRKFLKLKILILHIPAALWHIRRKVCNKFIPGFHFFIDTPKPGML
jgi:hypothetical protein